MPIFRTCPLKALAKRLRYAITLEANWRRHKMFPSRWPWWSPILGPHAEPLGLFLGALPLADGGHLEKIAALRVKAVLSLVEPFELKPQLHRPVTHEEWKKRGIEQKAFSTPDFRGICPATLALAVAFIEEHLQQGRQVYVHCKAGRARSAMVVICYLMKHYRLSAQRATHLVTSCRPHILLDKEKREGIRAFERTLLHR